MANPLSAYGISDRDYGAAIGTMVGEAGREGVKGMAAVADVLANRVANQKYAGYGDSVADQAKAGGGSQFNAWNSSNPRTIGAYLQAARAEAAATNPAAMAALPAAERKQLEQAAEAAFGVWGSGELRGVTKGATRYANKDVTDQWGTSAAQDKLEGQYGRLQIGNHTFTGPGFDPTAPFDLSSGIAKNWTAYQGSFNSPVERAAMANSMNRLRDTFREGMDFGAPVWDGTSNPAPTLAAQLSPVFSSALPDIAPDFSPIAPQVELPSAIRSSFPSIASDTTGFGPDSYTTGGGFDGEPFTTGGGFEASYPTVAQDQRVPSRLSEFSADVGPYSFSSMQPSPAMSSLGVDLSQQFASTTPAGFDFSTTGQDQQTVSPYEFSTVQPGSMGSFNDYSTGSPFGGPLNTAGVNPRAGQYNLTGLQANSLGYPDASLAPAAPLPSSDSVPGFASTWDVPNAPTADPYGMPPQAPAISSDAPAEATAGMDFAVDLPPEVPAPKPGDFGAPPAPKAPTVPSMAATPAVAAPRPSAPRAPRISMPAATPSTSASADMSAAPRFSAPDFSSAFNGLWSPVSAQQNRSAFSDRTGLGMAALNALTSAYDAGGMLTGAAYSALQDAFSQQPAVTSWSSMAPTPVTSSPLPDIGAMSGIGSWGQANGISGNWAQDTSNAASNARIENAGSLIDPLTGRDLRDLNASSFGGWGGFGGSWGGGFGDINPGLR
ncbi:MAG: cell wall hydrolase [Alsobacter sp.]